MAVIRWYKTDIRKLTFAELWRISPGAGFLVAAFHKLSGKALPMATRAPLLDSLDILPDDGLPADVLAAMSGAIGAWEVLGFSRSFVYTAPPASPGMRGFATVLLSADGLTLAEVVFVEIVRPVISRREMPTWCMSCLTGNRRLVASSGRRRFNSPPGVDALYLTGYPAESLYAAHRARLDTLRGEMPERLDRNGAARAILENSVRMTETMAARGVYIPA